MLMDPLVKLATTFGIRGAAYVIYIILIEPLRSVAFIVENETEKQVLSEFLNPSGPVIASLLAAMYDKRIKYSVPRFKVLCRDEYEKKWQSLPGWRIAIISVEKNMKYKGLVYLENLIKKSFSSTTLWGPSAYLRDSLLKLVSVIGDAIKESEERKFSSENELKSFLGARGRSGSMIELAIEIIKYRESLEIPT